MAISRALRFQILRRDDNTCRYCGRSAPEVKLTIDHVLPVALGGTDDAGNLVTACQECNGGKSATPPDAALVAQVDEDAIRWARARQAAADQMLAELQQREGPRQEFADRWNQWQAGGRPLALPAEWRQSVDQILSQGLPLPVLLECIDLAMRRRVRADNTFSYMCGIAWNKVKELDASARAVTQSTARGQGAVMRLLIEEFGEEEAAEIKEAAGSDDDLAIALQAIRQLAEQQYDLDAAVGSLSTHLPLELADFLIDQKTPRESSIAVVEAAAMELAGHAVRQLAAAQKASWLTASLRVGITDADEAVRWISRAQRYGGPPARVCGIDLGEDAEMSWCPELIAGVARFANCAFCEDECRGHSMCDKHIDEGRAGQLSNSAGQPLAITSVGPIEQPESAF